MLGYINCSIENLLTHLCSTESLKFSNHLTWAQLVVIAEIISPDYSWLRTTIVNFLLRLQLLLVRLFFIFQQKALNKRFADGQTNTAKLYADVTALKANGRRLHNLIQKAVGAIQEALKMKEDAGNADAALISYRRDHLLINLLELINRSTGAERERYE